MNKQRRAAIKKAVDTTMKRCGVAISDRTRKYAIEIEEGSSKTRASEKHKQ